MSLTVQPSGIIDWAFLQNLYEHGRGCGFLTGGVGSSAGTDLDTDYTAFQAVVDGTWVSVAAGNVTHDAADATNPRMDMVVVSSAGAVSIVKGTATPESSSQTRPPLGTLPAGSLILYVVYITNGITVIPAGNVFDRRVMIDITSEGPVVPYPTVPMDNSATQQMNSNTTARVTLVQVERTLSITRVTFDVSAVGTGGTLAYALFSNDGQTRLINEATAAISGTGEHTDTPTTTVVPPGLYYVMAVVQSTADLTFHVYDLDPNGPGGAAAPAGMNESSGTVTVTAGTIPATFDPDGGVTFAAAGAPIVRLN